MSSSAPGQAIGLASSRGRPPNHQGDRTNDPGHDAAPDRDRRSSTATSSRSKGYQPMQLHLDSSCITS